MNSYVGIKTSRIEKILIALLVVSPSSVFLAHPPLVQISTTIFGESYLAPVATPIQIPVFLITITYTLLLSYRLLRNWKLGFEQRWIALCFLSIPIMILQDASISIFHFPWIRFFDFGGGLILGVGMAIALVSRHGRQYMEVEQQALERMVALERKNQELQQFNYSVSHDLRAPLVNIRGFLEELRIDLKEGNAPAIEQDVLMMERSTNRLQSLFSDLLELSRAGNVIHHKTLVDTGQVVTDTLSILAPMLKDANAQITVSPHLPQVPADAMRLSQVFQNLLENAIKYRAPDRTLHIEIGHRAESTNHTFWVRDNGSGIQSGQQEKVWRLFEKLDKGSNGTGVGLALVRRIAEAHGGQAWLHSEGMNQGCTVYFSIPLH